MVALAAATSRAWRFLPAAPADEPADRRAAAGRGLTAALLVVLLVQLATGAGYRHTYTVEEKLPWPAHLHLTLAMFAVIMCIIAGMKAWARDGDTGRPLRRTGLAMNVAVMLQTLLGGAALIAILARDDQPYAAEVLLATAHQANGALVLAVAGLLFAWTRRLPAPLTDEEREAAGLPIVRTSVDVDFGPRSDLSEPAASPVDESAKPVTV
jgi:heme A synthase